MLYTKNYQNWRIKHKGIRKIKVAHFLWTMVYIPQKPDRLEKEQEAMLFEGMVWWTQ